uniref:Uncharacterized protein n=1 Tax=Vombatus ursinus TaxID=29139 RepID=A0A4X2LGN3_VOMUR
MEHSLSTNENAHSAAAWLTRFKTKERDSTEMRCSSIEAKCGAEEREKRSNASALSSDASPLHEN